MSEQATGAATGRPMTGTVSDGAVGGGSPIGGGSRDASSMRGSTTPGPITGEQRRYDQLVRKRVRVANLAALARAGGIQVVWLIVLIAGAAIPLTEALITEGWTWVSPVLGFVVVVAAGLERIFSRTTAAAVSLDRLRRELARERRLLIAEGSDAARFEGYVSRVEEAFARYDRDMVDYHAQVARETG